jgi:hypothetical protein
MTNPRERGRLAPRTEAVVIKDHDPIGARLPPVRARVPGPPREEVSSAEIRNALEHGYRSDSVCCQRKRAVEGERTIVYVNGILTSREDHCTTLSNIANLTCARVIGVYNATEGQLRDLTQVAGEKAQINDAAQGKPVPVGDARNPAVDTLRDVVVRTQRDPSILDGAPLELFAHSQGGAITSLSLFHAQSALKDRGRSALSNVRVTSFNGAAQRWVDGPQYEHYVHLGDFVGTTTGIGRHRMDETRVGRDATVIAYTNNPAQPGPAFSWREIRHDGRRGMGNALPEQQMSSYDPRVAHHHGIDNIGLGMYQQRADAAGTPTCRADAPGAEPSPMRTR